MVSGPMVSGQIGAGQIGAGQIGAGLMGARLMGVSVTTCRTEIVPVLMVYSCQLLRRGVVTVKTAGPVVP
jgi:hypothetical protein